MAPSSKKSSIDYSDTTNLTEFDAFEQAPEVKSYKGTPDELQRIGFINDRLTKMYFAKNPYPRMWDVWEEMVRARYKPTPSGEYKYGTAIARAMRDIIVTNLKDRPPIPKIHGEHGFEVQAQAMQYLWDYDWEQNNRANELLLDDYICVEKGTSILYTGFEIDKRILHDPIGDYVSGEQLQYKKMLETKANISLKSFDLRRFFIDEKAFTMEDAIDCIAVQYVPLAAFFSFKLNNSWGYKNLDSVTDSQNYFAQFETLPYVSDDERGKFYAKYVRLDHYYNKISDDYIIIANRTIEIFKGHLQNASHELPFSVRQCFRNTNCIYGTGICEILLPFVDKFNKAFDIYLNAVFHSNQQMIAMGGNLAFEGQIFQYANNFLKFRGDLNDNNFRQLTGLPPNESLPALLTALYEEVVMNTGIDLKAIMAPGDATAYQVSVKQNISVKRMSNIIDNRDFAYGRTFRQHMDNMQLHYPRDVVNQLVEVDDSLQPVEAASNPPMQIPVKGKILKKGKFRNKDSGSVFELTPDVIRGQMKVVIETNLNAPVIPEVEKQQIIDFYTQGLPGLANSYMQNPELQNLKPKADAIKEMADMFNVDTLQSSTQINKELKEKLFTALETAHNALTQGPTPTLPAQTPGQPAPGASVSQPNPQLTGGTMPTPNTASSSTSPTSGPSPIGAPSSIGSNPLANSSIGMPSA